jgi:hypothetical protein
METTAAILTPDEVPLYLLKVGLLSPKDIVRGGVEVVSVARRNHNFRVITSGGPCWFLKQGIGPEGHRGIAREAAVYDLLKRTGHTARDFAGILPAYYRFDPGMGLLVLDSKPDLQSFFEYQGARRRISRAKASGVGRALALIHREVVEPEDPANGHRSLLPFGLRLHQPDVSIYEFASQGCLEVIKTVQESSELSEALDSVGAEWRGESFIHGDARWDNCLVGARQRSGGSQRTWLVDWELARTGDPYWDTGAHLGEYLHCWIRSAPLSGATPPARFIEFARTPLISLWPAIQAFWTAYTSVRKLGPSQAGNALIRTIRYAGSWLVQAAFEAAQGAAHASCHTICMLQVAANVLHRPREAAARLLGLSPSLG